MSKDYFPPEFKNPDAYTNSPRTNRTPKANTPKSARTKDRGTARRTAIGRSIRNGTT